MITAAAMLLLAAGAAALFFAHENPQHISLLAGRVYAKELTSEEKTAGEQQAGEKQAGEKQADSRWLTVRNAETGQLYARYPISNGDWFSIGFIHSVNKSPLTDYYEIRDDKIFVEKTVYYGFGAGVQTEIEDGQTLEYGEDGSMIVSGFHKEIPDLVYIVGTVSDHTLVVNGGEEISLRELCGRHSKVRFSIEEFSTEEEKTADCG